MKVWGLLFQTEKQKEPDMKGYILNEPAYVKLRTRRNQFILPRQWLGTPGLRFWGAGGGRCWRWGLATWVSSVCEYFISCPFVLWAYAVPQLKVQNKYNNRNERHVDFLFLIPIVRSTRGRVSYIPRLGLAQSIRLASSRWQNFDLPRHVLWFFFFQSQAGLPSDACHPFSVD